MRRGAIAVVVLITALFASVKYAQFSRYPAEDVLPSALSVHWLPIYANSDNGFFTACHVSIWRMQPDFQDRVTTNPASVLATLTVNPNMPHADDPLILEWDQIAPRQGPEAFADVPPIGARIAARCRENTLPAVREVIGDWSYGYYLLTRNEQHSVIGLFPETGLVLFAVGSGN